VLLGSPVLSATVVSPVPPVLLDCAPSVVAALSVGSLLAVPALASPVVGCPVVACPVVACPVVGWSVVGPEELAAAVSPVLPVDWVAAGSAAQAVSAAARARGSVEK